MISLRRLASSSALRALDVGVQALATLWITPLLVHTLGKERYGLWITVLTLVSYLDLFDLGMTNATSRYVARALGKGDIDAARATARSAFTVLALIGLCCLVLVGLLTMAIPHLLPSAPESLPLKALVLILGGTAALSFPLRVFSGVLEAFVRYEYTTAASLIRTVLSTLALAWVLTHGASLLHVVIVVTGSGLLQRAMNLIFAQRVLPEMRLLSFQTTRESRRELLGYGAKNFLMKVVDLFRFRIDNVVIAQIVNVAAVSVYAPGMAIIRYIREFIECFGAVAMPVFSRAEGAGDRATIRRHLASATKITTVISVFAGGSIMLYGGYFIERWLGPAFADTQRVVLILGLPFIFAMAQNPGIYLLYGLSRQERLLRLNVIEAVINFGLSVALAFPFGIFGVAAGTAVAMLITKTVLQPTIVCEESGLSRRVYYFALMLRPMLVTALPMLLAYAVCVTWLRPVYWQIVLACAAQTLLVAPVVWWFVFGEDGRAALTGMVARRAA